MCIFTPLLTDIERSLLNNYISWLSHYRLHQSFIFLPRHFIQLEILWELRKLIFDPSLTKTSQLENHRATALSLGWFCHKGHGAMSGHFCHIWEEVTYSHVIGRGQRYSSISPNAHREPPQQWMIWPQMSGEPRRKGFAIYGEACLASLKYSIPTPNRKLKPFSKNIILKSIYAELTYQTVSVIH